MANTPIHAIPLVPEGTLDPAAGLNQSIVVIDALLQTFVLSMALTAPPGSAVDGDTYIVASPATGAWLGLEDYLVRYVVEGDFWQAYSPGDQVVLVLNQEDSGLYIYDLVNSPGGWVLGGGLPDAPSDGTTYGRKNGAWEAVAGAAANDTVTVAASASGVLNINLALGDYFTIALSENVTSLTFSNLPGSGKGASKMLRFTQDSTPRTVAWPASFRWAGGVAGAVSTGSGAIDLLAITTLNNGTNWNATLAKAFA